MLSLKDSVNKIHLVKPSFEKALNNLGLYTVEDLLCYFPRAYEDLSKIETISQINTEEKITVRALVKKVSLKFMSWRRMSIVEALIEDHTGSILAVWFNQPFIKRSLQEGKQYYFHGKGQYPKTGSVQMLKLLNPAFEMVKSDTIHTAGIIPIYDLTEGITQKQIRYWLKKAHEALSQVQDHLPEAYRKKLELVGLREAIAGIHFPKNNQQAESAKNRLAFDELFLFQLAFQSQRQHLKAIPAQAVPLDLGLIRSFIQGLPFRLTDGQRMAIWEILQDMSRSYPMNRLLEGDVGSGKTVVAGIAMLETGSAGFQSVMLAPTEILAWQHFEALSKFFSGKLPIALLTRSHKIGDLPGIKTGKTKIIIGTHALLEDNILFHNTSLVVVDEQHRFGVKQRAKLLSTGLSDRIPHLLSMSATPIPRTLALAFYGDLDISRLTELPTGRKKIITKLVSADHRGDAYAFLKREIGKGRQAYIVTPLVDESDKLALKSAIQEAQILQSAIFPELSIGLLHGQMKGEQKKEIMDRFKSGKHQILVSTTVVEVGVDVPNATMMVIENAERFGLAQLHQLRGRVGRSDLQSYCLLFPSHQNVSSLNRLKALIGNHNGFELAEIDLKLRGSGEMIGIKQSGFVPFRMADISDTRMIRLAQKQAEFFLQNDPQLSSVPLLKAKVSNLVKNAHME